MITLLVCLVLYALVLISHRSNEVAKLHQEVERAQFRNLLLEMDMEGILPEGVKLPAFESSTTVEEVTVNLSPSPMPKKESDYERTDRLVKSLNSMFDKIKADEEAEKKAAPVATLSNLIRETVKELGIEIPAPQGGVDENQEEKVDVDYASMSYREVQAIASNLREEGLLPKSFKLNKKQPKLVAAIKKALG